MSRYICLFFFGIYPIVILWYSWICDFVSVTNFGKFSTTIFFKYFFCPFSHSSSGILIMLILHCLILSRAFEWFVLFSPAFFSLHFSLGNFYCPIFKFILCLTLISSTDEPIKSPFHLLLWVFLKFLTLLFDSYGFHFSTEITYWVFQAVYFFL